MKKLCIYLILLLSFLLLSGCSLNELPGSTTRPLPSAGIDDISQKGTETADPDETPAPSENPEKTATPTIDPAKDERNNPDTIRSEINTMLRDAEELIKEGLYDDAKTLLRDIRSRNLTTAEKQKADELLSRMITISN